MAVKTLKASGGDYSTITAWLASLPSTLTGPEELECYDFDLDEGIVVAITGKVTSASNYIRIYAASGCQWNGVSRSVSGTGFRIKNNVNGFAVSIACNHVRLEGLEIQGSSTTQALTYEFGTFAAAANDNRITGCLIHDTNTSAGYTMYASVSNLRLAVSNSVVYGSQRTMDTRSAALATFENCTFWRHAAELGTVCSSEASFKNCYSGRATGSSEDYWSGGAPTGNNNVSSDTTATARFTSSVNSIAGSVVFVSVTSGAEDFRLVAGTNGLVDVGATLGTVLVDAIGVARPQGAAYDVGAFERASAASLIMYLTGGFL